MPGPSFDVFVVGSRDASPAGQAKLAAAIASRQGAPLPAVARAIAERNLRVGMALGPVEAQTLGRQLEGLGAVTELRPAAGAPNPAKTSWSSLPTIPTAAPAPSSRTTWSNLPSVPAASSNPASRSGTWQALTSVGSSSGNAPGSVVEAFPSLPSSPALEPAPAAAPAPRPARPAIPDPFAAEASLELDTDRAGRSEELPRPSASVAGASALNLKGVVATSSASGVEIDGPDKPHNVRCTQHGLFYDKRKASGCRKCMEPARKRANTFETPLSTVLGLRENPPKRAFLGLGFALAIGALPAAYVALRVGAGDVNRLRAEQAELSAKPGTEEIMRQFHDVDLAVHAAHQRSMRNTALCWLLVTGGALAAWYRLT